LAFFWAFLYTYAMNISSLFVATAHAASPFSLQPAGNPGVSTTDLPTTITNVTLSILSVLLVLAGAMAILYLVWAGIQYISAGGSADKAKAGRSGIINAVIGIIVIMAAFFLIRFAISLGNSAACADLPAAQRATCK
jgi:hypothetical protein